MPIRRAKREDLIERVKNLRERQEKLVKRAKKIGWDFPELEDLKKKYEIDKIFEKVEKGKYKGILGARNLDKFELALGLGEELVNGVELVNKLEEKLKRLSREL